MFVACFVWSLKLSHSVRIKAASGAAQINVPNISGDTPLMGCGVSEGKQEGVVRRGEEGRADGEPRRQPFSPLWFALGGFFPAVISSAGWVLQDVLQVVRRWVRWRHVIDGVWAQRRWLSEIGRRCFLTSGHYSLPLEPVGIVPRRLVVSCSLTHWWTDGRRVYSLTG